MRTVSIGNSGSGKTWLSRRLGNQFGVPVVHLHEIFWLPGGFDAKREPSEVAEVISRERAAAKWIVKDVYGDLASEFLPAAQTLIWLDLPWPVCKLRLGARGSESKSHMNHAQTKDGLKALIAWAEGYSSRRGPSGRLSHASLFELFTGERHRFELEDQVQAFLTAA